MVTPGVLPEAADRRLSPWPFTLALLGVALLAGCGYLVVQVMRLRAERDRLVAELKAETIRAAYEEQLRRDPQDVRITHREVVPQEPSPRPGTSSARAPEVRVVPREQVQERITQGLHEFRSGRYLQAELAFLRAVPEAFGYIVITCFLRGEVREAVNVLGRALASDPEWLRRVKPRDLFGAPEDYEKALRALEERVAADPLDAEAKTLLAYFQFHEKGPEYAKALLVEASNARPDLAEARHLQAAIR